MLYTDHDKSRFYNDSERQNDTRSPFERDRARIIHSAAFRRLQGKTQVFGLGGSDFFRTRLTHSLETAQIGKSLTLFLNKKYNLSIDTDLVEAACLAHDIGHPPFGHVGEDILKKKMWDYGSFEANAQNLRILCILEAKHREGGLNLTRATLDSILKYKEPFSIIKEKCNEKEKCNKTRVKFYYDSEHKFVSWICGCTKLCSIECLIMDWADDIAYSTHDLEDGIKAGMITSENIEIFYKEIKDEIKQERMDVDDDRFDKCWEFAKCKIKSAMGHYEREFDRKTARKEAISSIIHEFIISTAIEKNENWNNYLPLRYKYKLRFENDVELKCDILKRLVWKLIISDERVATLRHKAENIVSKLFDELTKWSNDKIYQLYPRDFREKLVDIDNKDYSDDQKRQQKYRIACDYIAGMTDTYAIKMYSRLLESDITSIFEII